MHIFVIIINLKPNKVFVTKKVLDQNFNFIVIISTSDNSLNETPTKNQSFS